jgi:hypothetical protein
MDGARELPKLSARIMGISQVNLVVLPDTSQAPRLSTLFPVPKAVFVFLLSFSSLIGLGSLFVGLQGVAKAISSALFWKRQLLTSISHKISEILDYIDLDDAKNNNLEGLIRELSVAAVFSLPPSPMPKFVQNDVIRKLVMRHSDPQKLKEGILGWVKNQYESFTIADFLIPNRLQFAGGILVAFIGFVLIMVLGGVWRYLIPKGF